MGKGFAFGKTIFIGDQFVQRGVPAIVSALPFETVADVERVDGDGWILEDNRIEVPGYKERKKEQQVDSINRILDVMGDDVKNTTIKITYGGTLLAGSGLAIPLTRSIMLDGKENLPIIASQVAMTTLDEDKEKALKQVLSREE